MYYLLWLFGLIIAIAAPILVSICWDKRAAAGGEQGNTPSR